MDGLARRPVHGQELTEFEASLPDKAAAEDEKREAQQTWALCSKSSCATASDQRGLLQPPIRTARTRKLPPRSAASAIRSQRGGRFRRLFWTGAASLALFLLCAVFVIREKRPTDQSQYLTQILNARVDPAVSPNATISMFEAKEDKVTVLWIEGLQSLPSDTQPNKAFDAKSGLSALSARFWRSWGGRTIGARTAEMVWSGLVIADNVAQPEPIPAGIKPIEQTL